MIFETTFFFWWCTTLVKFGWEVAPQRFLFEWKSMSEKFGREVAPPHFHFQSKSASHAEVAPLHYFFWTDFWFPHYRRGGRLRHIGPQKKSHVLSNYKRQEHVSKTRETCEQHTRNMWATCEKHASISGPWLHSTGTFLPFSYGIETTTILRRKETPTPWMWMPSEASNSPLKKGKDVLTTTFASNVANLDIDPTNAETPS